MDSMGCIYEILDKSTIAGEPIGSIKVKTSYNLDHSLLKEIFFQNL